MLGNIHATLSAENRGLVSNCCWDWDCDYGCGIEEERFGREEVVGAGWNGNGISNAMMEIEVVEDRDTCIRTGLVLILRSKIPFLI